VDDVAGQLDPGERLGRVERALVLAELDSFYEDVDLGDDPTIGLVVEPAIDDVVDIPLHSTWTERVMRRIGYVKARQNEIETIS